MKPPPLRKIMRGILGLVASTVILFCLAPQSSAQNRKSVVRRIQVDQQRRARQVADEASRFRREHERRLLEWRRWEERLKKKALRP